MADAEAETGVAAETEIDREEAIEALVEEAEPMAAAEVAAVEEAVEATTTTTMQEEAVATSMEAEAGEAIKMHTRTTSIS